MSRKRLFREIEPGENKEKYLDYIESICRTTTGRRLYGGRPNRFAILKWNIYNPEDQVTKGDGYLVHHRDENPMNDDISNLMKMTKGEHMALHNKDNKYNLGKHPSEEIRKKQSEAMKGNKNGLGNKNRAKKVMAVGIEFSSGREAAKALGVSPTMICRRIKAQKAGYFYISDFIKDFETELSNNLEGILC